MTPAALKAPIPRFALTKPEGAASLGMSLTFFEEHVYPHLDVIRRGKKVLIPVSEIERWTRENTETVLPGGGRGRDR